MFRVNIVRKLEFSLDRKSLETMYFSLIRPLSDTLWDNCIQYEANEVEKKIQNEAARTIVGATKLVLINALLQAIGWESLASRRMKHKLLLFHMMQNGPCPNYLSVFVTLCLEDLESILVFTSAMPRGATVVSI